eukprot:Plantae.Rhodophyta-Rhodochaete_pulchella.ctg43377.p2 GENE.Plantae.Rhodophyta-Rhodochaete_pulchella.ctg43377~~Plantae.Rhodophyta-Rhodochaete_pulchella.ctg43377.p2  ORF type:complete len:104 (-),score=23.58 Plantae.Rhodophyta-Rhodochaete_pulchella.ctg43377:100-411(-)
MAGMTSGFDPSAMSAVDQARMMGMVQELQMQDSLKMYNDLVHRCFCECVDSFRYKKLDGKEEACITKCAEKFTKFGARVGLRFTETQQEMMEEAQKMAAGAQK